MDVVSFVNAQHDGRIDSKEPIPEEPQFPDHEEWPLVFTHGDLSLSNIMLSDDGTLWIVDWADSGFYPPWMEALGVYRYENHPQSWKRLRWLMLVQLRCSRRIGSISARFVKDMHRWSPGKEPGPHKGLLQV
ncbi:hypothetical protein M413DRAFT_29675 [Hebeloma cylindrosporum]|uniref:Aminoglycoside phosphotransferase domain-containing protein n=1 Tax=Hebeloma cylindrosporum TaxID=76867 RepID=A0A0C3C6B8_HEBCY|nr:hypothetical protein M413DRAFT_29675 [Hebeloma cylindrosporum h7]